MNELYLHLCERVVFRKKYVRCSSWETCVIDIRVGWPTFPSQLQETQLFEFCKSVCSDQELEFYIWNFPGIRYNLQYIEVHKFYNLHNLRTNLRTLIVEIFRTVSRKLNRLFQPAQSIEYFTWFINLAIIGVSQGL